MADLELRISIAAPPNLVAAFFVPQRMVYWYGAEMDAQIELERGASEFRASQKARITGRLGRRELTLTVVVTEHEWGRALEWQFHDAYGVRGMQRWELEPEGAGTSVQMQDRYEMPGRIGRLADSIFTRYAVARRDRRWLENLKRAVERQPA